MMRTDAKLSTLAAGRVEELFQDAFSRVLDNLQDLRTPVEGKGAARVITIELAVVPSGDRSVAVIEASVKTKLAPPAAVATMMHLVGEGGTSFAAEVVQERLFTSSN